MLGQALFLAIRLVRIFTPDQAWWLGGTLGLLYAHLPGREQRRCREHLALAFPQRTAAQRWQLMAQCFRHHGGMTLWTICTLTQDPRRLARRMPIEGRAALMQTLRASRRGEGTVIVSAHLGNWELLARVSGTLTPVTVIGRRMRHDAVDRFLHGIRSHGENEVCYQDDDPRRLLRALRAGRLVASLPDQDVGRLAGCFVPWFGQLAYTPLGPAALAQLGRCALQPVYCYRRDRRWVMHWGPRFTVPAAGPRGALQCQATARYTAYLEAMTRRHPDQWVWFHRRWRRRPADRPLAPVADGAHIG